MNPSQIQTDRNGFLSLTTLGTVFIVTSVIAFALWYIGVGDYIVDFLDRGFDLLLDGEALGEWIGGVVAGSLIGLISALWDFGTDVGAGLDDIF